MSKFLLILATVFLGILFPPTLIVMVPITAAVSYNSCSEARRAARVAHLARVEAVNRKVGKVFSS